MKPDNSILVIDDDVDFYNLIKHDLDKSGYHVTYAQNEKEALALLEKESFSCALIDIVLGPKETSGGIVHYLASSKLESLNHQLPVILCSAYMTKEFGAKVKARGVNIIETLAKPFRINTITQCLETVPSKSVLLLDDDAEFLKLIKNELEKSGFTPIPATSVKEALSFLEKKKILCCIFDIVLGRELTSEEAISFLKSDKNKLNFNTPLIITSAFMTPTHAENIKKNSKRVAFVIPKPGPKGVYSLACKAIYSGLDQVAPEKIPEKIQNYYIPAYKDENEESFVTVVKGTKDEVQDEKKTHFRTGRIEIRNNDSSIVKGSRTEYINDETTLVKGTQEELFSDEIHLVKGGGTEILDDETRVIRGNNVKSSDDEILRVSGEKVEVNESGHTLIQEPSKEDLAIENEIESLLHLEKKSEAPAPVKRDSIEEEFSISRGEDFEAPSSNKLINHRNSNGETKLMLEAARGDFNAVKNILLEGANILLKSKNGKTALHYCAASGNIKTLKLLLQNGAKITERDDEGLEPLGVAILNTHPDMVQELLNRGSRLKTRINRRPYLVVADEIENLEIFKMLLAAGADVLERDPETGFSLIEILTKKGKQEWLDLIKKHLKI